VSYAPEEAITGKAGDDKDPQTFNFHTSAASVIAPHGFNFIFIQACIAILILVGFESVTRWARRPRTPSATFRAPCSCRSDPGPGVLPDRVLRRELPAAQWLHHADGAAPPARPLGDMMVIVGTWLFGSYAAGKAFMLVQAFTVFLALIGTTLSCLSTGARVTYAMGRDEEVPSHFGMLHGKTLSPHRAIWTLAIISAIIGCIITVAVYLGGTTPAALDKHNIWYSFGIFSPETYAKLPNTLVIVTLVSNFGTFLLYMITCMIAIVAFREHHSFNGFKHVVVPVFGLLANLACMLFYLIGPFTVAGHELEGALHRARRRRRLGHLRPGLLPRQQQEARQGDPPQPTPGVVAT
jgi:APA family basic amino acid/polyamine antiporter